MRHTCKAKILGALVHDVLNEMIGLPVPATAVTQVDQSLSAKDLAQTAWVLHLALDLNNPEEVSA